MSICFSEQSKTFLIHTESSSYAFCLNSDGSMTNLHWGAPVQNDFDLPDPAYLRSYSLVLDSEPSKRGEFCPWGNKFFAEPCLKVTHADGVRDSELVYRSHTLSSDENELTVTLRDRFYPLEVDLHYKTYSGLDLIDKWSVIRNVGSESIFIESAMSGSVYLPDCRKFRLTLLGSAPNREYDLRREWLNYGKTVIESRTLYSNSNYLPYFALDEGTADEEHGEIWFGTLRWCGNYKIAIESMREHPIRIVAGLNDFDFRYPLDAGSIFATPVFTIGYTSHGFGSASRMFHRFQKDYFAPRSFRHTPLPVLYNAWAAFEFKIDAQKLMELTTLAASIGTELFVIDDGWFGSRDDDTSGLGDWYPNPKKFPHGLTPIIEKCKSLGMHFGLWIEPEMVNPDSDLYRAHPDWVFHFPTRERETQRNQLMLNLAKPEVKAYILETLDRLLTEHDIFYLKWDSNRFLSQPGWSDAPAGMEQAYHYLYTQAVYEIFAHLRDKYPHVLLENCASGGMRADLSMAEYASRINRSDNQDPRDVLYLHEGFTYLNRPKLAGGGSQISRQSTGYGMNGRHVPLSFTAHMAMLGSMSIGFDLRTLTQEELEAIRGYVAEHKQYRETVQNGDLYRLASPREHSYAIYSYVSEKQDDVLVFAFGLNLSFGERLPLIRLAGLHPQAVYVDQSGKRYSGQGLMNIGIPITLRGDYDSVIFHFKQIN